MRCVLPLAAVLLSATFAAPALAKQPVAHVDGAAKESTRPPWPARVRIPRRGYERAYALLKPHEMPAEPPAPQGALDAKRFASALETVCDGHIKPKRAAKWTKWILQYASDFDVDPFTISTLIRFQSDCRAKTPRRSKGKRGLGAGPARIRYVVHRPFVKDGTYLYWIKQGRIWKPRRIQVGRFAFTPRTLKRPEVSIYFAAALLAVYSDQAPDLDAAFPQRKHRHPVSHMVWGDRVRGTGAEERVLRDRRRMLQYYTGVAPAPKGRYKKLALTCPVDGVPRKITGGFWNKRGGRRHSGFDFFSHTGEPVRSISDGVVYFAGYQRRRGLARSVSPKKLRYVRRSWMGGGGLFVLIRHKNKLQSGYFHLKDFTVKRGQRVKAGQLIGHVGRSGIRRSPAHLHFELRRGHRRINPARYFKGDVLPLKATYFGRVVAGPRYRWSYAYARRHRRKRRLRRKRRRARRLARLRRLRAKKRRKTAPKSQPERRAARQVVRQAQDSETPPKKRKKKNRRRRRKR